MGEQRQHGGIQVVQVRICNFRSLKRLEVNLDRVTVLIGANNSGKTSFLEALYAAMGTGRRTLTEEDIYLAPSEHSVPRERSIIIDVLVRPIGDNGAILDAFPEGSYWTALWGPDIAQDEQDNDFLAYRTQMTWNHARGEYTTERRFLTNWPADASEMESKGIGPKPRRITATQIEPTALHFMDAKRDIEEDLRRQGSFWRRMTSDLGLSQKDVEDIETALSEINERMVSASDVLAHVKGHLERLSASVSTDAGDVEVAPVARRLRDLSKGIDVNFATKGAQAFPLSRHGMGTRSMSSILVFRAFMEWRSLKSEDSGIHPMLALEEPEAHLHPQAQRALVHQLRGIPGQLIVSTHSPYVAGQTSIKHLRLFRKDGPDTSVSQVRIDEEGLDNGFALDSESYGLDEDALAKMDRKVMSTRGDLLFAQALVLFEGETEELALPIFAEAYWGQNPNALGISFIGVGGAGSYKPFLQLADCLHLPWYILSDGEQKAIAKLTKALEAVGVQEPEEAPNVSIFAEGRNWEAQMVHEGYQEAITAMLDEYHEQEGYLEAYIQRNHDQPAKGGGVRDYESSGGRGRALVDALSGGKTDYARPLAEAIAKLSDEERRVPSVVRVLFERIDKDVLGGSRNG